MQYRELGRTGWKVSTVSFGAWAIGSAWGAVDATESLNALRRAVDLGVNFFDTADVYGDGHSERLLAQLKRERKEDIVHVDALGVVAIGVGGLEAENVMLGRASWMRLPDVVGVELTSRPQPGITATDVVLALTEFLRKEKVVGAYLEFRGEGAAALGLGDRATISNMAPEYGATAAMFFIDDNTLHYLRLTGRDDAQVRLVEIYAKEAGLWADSLKSAEYERVLTFDLSTVVRNMAGPSNPHRRLPTTDLAARGIAGPWEEVRSGCRTER